MDRLEEALDQIARWAEAYPVEVFPEIDAAYLRKAHEVLVAHGMTLDRISAFAMRHAIVGVGRIARNALGQQKFDA